VDATLVQELRETVDAGYVHDRPSEIISYSYDGTFQQRRPDLAISPASTEEVAQIVKIAAREKIPIVARGASSGLAGGTIPESGGIILNLARMDRVLEIDTANVCVVAQAGVVTLQLQQAVEKIGLFYPPDPASSRQSTIGGNVATNAGGPRCLKYGVTRDYVIGLTVVLANGEILRLGGRITKNATGYQLMQLIVGSEGTLGIVTEVILKLAPLPRARVTAVASFPRLTAASQAVSRIMASGILPATLELMDGTTINVVEDFLKAGLPRQAEALLLLEQDGGDDAVARADVERMAEICRSLGAADVTIASTAAERDQLWAARRAVSPALGRLRPNKLGEDIVVPKTAIPEMIEAVREIAGRYELPIPVFGTRVTATCTRISCSTCATRRKSSAWSTRRAISSAPQSGWAARSVASTVLARSSVSSLKKRRARLPCSYLAPSNASSTPTGCSTPVRCSPRAAGPTVSSRIYPHLRG
jgi:glycolate oxidase